ncbi:MAG TPA: GNAT family N-acetyltransferase [Solirubrobacteraceae bacterium]|jgi:phosphinothricin acetyltransferase
MAEEAQALGAVVVRDAVASDLPGLLEIYNEVIANSTAVFSDQPVTLEDRERWLAARHAEGFPVLVAVDSDGVVGFGSFGAFRTWPGYRTTVEHSVHVRAERRGEGIGSTLLAALIERARALGKHVIIAGVEAGNAASIRLHERLGFTSVAHLSEVARKFDRWLDLVFMQRIL